MVGYKDEKYCHFGWASARCDDLANYLPARITGLLLVTGAFLLGKDWRNAMKTMVRDASKHASPNSGYPESAVAGALQIQLGGTNYYGGIARTAHFLGNKGAPLNEHAIGDAVRMMYCASLLMISFVLTRAEGFYIMQIHGGNVREIARTYSLDEEGVLDFSSNCNPLGFPPGIRSLFQREARTILHYPDTLCTELVRALAHENGVREKNIIVGNGSTELIYLIPRALKPRVALIVNPAFGEYERSLSSMGCEIVCIHLNEKSHFRINTDEVIPLLSRVDILYLCNPGNPTGVLTGRDEISP